MDREEKSEESTWGTRASLSQTLHTRYDIRNSNGTFLLPF